MQKKDDVVLPPGFDDRMMETLAELNQRYGHQFGGDIMPPMAAFVSLFIAQNVHDKNAAQHLMDTQIQAMKDHFKILLEKRFPTH